MRQPDPATVVDTAGVDPEAFREERDRLGRSTALVKRWLPLVMVPVIVVHLLGILGVVPMSTSVPLFIAAVVALVGAAFLFNAVRSRRARPFRERADAELVQPVLSSWAREVDRLHGTTGGHLQLGAADERLLRDAGIVDTGDSVHCGESVTGVVAGRSLAVCEYRITEQQGSGEDRETVQIFRGLVAWLPLARAVRGEVRVSPHSRAGFTGGSRLLGGRGLVMENPAFSDWFRVEATDPQQAYYLLTPTVQQHLAALAHRHQGDLALRAVDGQLFLALDLQRDLFDLDLDSRAEVRQDLERIAGELNDVLQVAGVAGAWPEEVAGGQGAQEAASVGSAQPMTVTSGLSTEPEAVAPRRRGWLSRLGALLPVVLFAGWVLFVSSGRVPVFSDEGGFALGPKVLIVVAGGLVVLQLVRQALSSRR